MALFNCIQCGTEFKQRSTKTLFCSTTCRGNNQSKRITINCLCCNIEFKAKLSVKDVKCCSRICSDTLRKRRVALKCKHCNKEFDVKKSELKKNPKFCSSICRISHNIIIKNCAVCQKEFKTRRCQKATFCSVKCSVLSKENKLVTKCKVCCVEFKYVPNQKRIYCSTKCSSQNQTTSLIKSCIVCQKEFKTKLSVDSKCCSNKCQGISRKSEFKNAEKIKQLTLATIENLDIEQIPNETQFTDWQIEDIFKLDIINTMDIGEDVTLFSLKNA